MSFHEAVVAALTHALGSEAEKLGDLSRMLSSPPKPEMGDLAFGCFALARVFKKAPVEIAADLVAKVQSGGLIEKVQAAGPFLNFYADPVGLLDWVARNIHSGELYAMARTDKPERVMVEFSQPNTHKTFHVGHLRNVALGDALVRIQRERGHTVVPVNYYGDFGIDVAKCLWWLRNHPENEAPEVNRAAWLGDAYTAANQALKIAKDASESEVKEKRALLTEVREILAGMEEHEPEVTHRYQETRQWCLDDFAEVYRWLGVEFEHDFFESEMEQPANILVDQYLEQGVFKVDDGAVICPLQPKIKTPAMVRKSDGSSLYMTWDLALASAKFDGYGIERSLYVVGTEQKFHFQQLFATLEKMGYARAKDCRHVSYELVMLPEGKMSSRNGTAVPLHQLRETVSQAIETRMDESGRTAEGEERAEAIRRISVACLKYGMLSVGNTKRVIFKLEDWVNPEGDTGAYLLYSLARISGVFRKSGVDVDLGAGLSQAEGFGEGAERALLAHLLKYPSVVIRSEESLDPSIVAGYVYECARLFSRFYANCPILRSEGDLRTARLMLGRATESVMTRGLGLLGIETVSTM
jgi:arginyl-tRNA synthetase